jgi:hypothetical protein
MSEKEKSLEEKKFVPYEPNALIMWGVVTSILFLFTETMIIRFGVVVGGLFLAVCITGAAISEHHMTKKVNQRLKNEELTKKQKFIEMVYIFHSIFGILMTVALVKAEATNLIYVIWIFLIGFVSFIAGHILNQKSFTYHGIASAMIAFGILYMIYFSPNGLVNSGLSYLFRILSVMIIGGGYIWLGLEMKRELKNM